MSPKKPVEESVNPNLATASNVNNNTGPNASEAVASAASAPKPGRKKRSIKQMAEDAENKNPNQIGKIKEAGKKANENEQSTTFELAMAMAASSKAAGLNAGSAAAKNVEEKYDNLKQGIKGIGEFIKEKFGRMKPAPSTPNPEKTMEDSAQKGATGAQAVVTNLQDVKHGRVTAGQDKKDDVETQNIKPSSPKPN